MSYDSDESWTILSPIEQSIKRKIEEIGTPLKNWNITINYGIKTGFNDSFIINGARKNELIAADPKSAEINSSLFSPLMMNASLNPVNIPRLILTSQSFNFMPILTIFPCYVNINITRENCKSPQCIKIRIFFRRLAASL